MDANSTPATSLPSVKNMRRNFSKFYGNVPKHTWGQNRGKINRELLATKYNISVSDLFKAYQNWIVIFRYPTSNLTFEQYLDKLKNSNLAPIDIGNGVGKYNLSRLNDEGGYTNETTRFILQKENLLEQKKLFKNRSIDLKIVSEDLKSQSIRFVSRKHNVSRSVLRKIMRGRNEITSES